MPKQIFGIDSTVTSLNRAFNDQSPSNAVYNNQVTQATAVGANQFALSFGASFAALTEDQLSTKILGNLGVLPNTGLQAAVKDYLVSVGKANVGIVAMQLADILSGLENATGDQAAFNAAAVKWNNEVTASYTYSANPANTGASPIGDTDTTVTGVTLSLTAGDDFLSPQAAEAKFKTTANNDTIVGGSANLTAGDVVDGGAGTDTLKAAIQANGVAPTVTNVENFFISNTNATWAFDLKNTTGVQQVWNDGSAVATTFNTVALGTTVGLKDTTGDTTFNFTKATGTADAATLVLSGSGAGNTQIDAIETLSVQSTVKANTLVLKANTLETITVTGDKGLTLSATAANAGSVKAVDASAATAAVSLDLANNANGVNVKGGAGADTVSAVGATKAVTIDGGAGADTISVTASKGHTLTGGAGNDSFNVSIGAKGAYTGNLTATDLTTSAKLIAAAVKIADFASGDTLTLNGTNLVVGDVVKLTGTQVENLSSTNDLLNVLSDLTDTNLPAGSGTTTTIVAGIAQDKAVSFVVGGNSYIFVNGGAGAGLDAGDILIQLTGVTTPSTITFAA
ncbi:beta strand repeat-containing protein [Acidovorax sp.]|uniref:beta strand repeat-containing protein n=1 Tax=Acidovorax sp. TaxID=1872122 RepID=UPI003CFD1B38